ncbi:MAG: discoidin domain-containing protein [Verrucomicrobiota bacterium]
MNCEGAIEVFRELAGWEIFASGQARGKISLSGKGVGARLRIDYDFHGGSGWVAARKAVSWQMPESYQFGFDVGGEGPLNHLEFKLTDPSGANAWRWQRVRFPDAKEGRQVCIHERELPYAWGPAGSGAAKEIGAVEWVIVAGPGGKGYVEIRGVECIDETLRGPFLASSSSEEEDFPAHGALDGQGWKSAPEDQSPWWMVDFERSARIGGLVIHWRKDEVPESLRVEVSLDGMLWEIVHEADGLGGAAHFIPMHAATARCVRLEFPDGPAALRYVEIKPDAFSTSANDVLHDVVGYFHRGWFPRYWYREQSYWTTLGAPWGRKRGLINEEGLVEIDEASFSLEPFVEVDGRWISWAEVATRAVMPPTGVPMPSVIWQTPDWSLRVNPWMTGRETKQALVVAYELHPEAVVTRFAVAVRPYQVNPPWQNFRDLGGVAMTRKVSSHVEGLLVDKWRLICDPVPGDRGGVTSNGGGLIEYFLRGAKALQRQVEDERGFASGVMIWDVPRGEKLFRVSVVVPYQELGTEVLHIAGRGRMARLWHSVLEKVKWSVPHEATAVFSCWKTAAGHILINRDGAAIQPGPRRYSRSWVRDCVVMGAALAKAGRVRPLKDFLVWYSGYQREDGFVPAVVDREGVDWLVEHDSHGQFLWGVREAWRFGGRKTLVAALWEHVELAAEMIMDLRRRPICEECVDEAAFKGLLPESVSHEGYLSHPVHSFWDNFWGVRGMEAASDLAALIGKERESERWGNEALDFEDDVLRSMKVVIKEKKLDYLPGSVEWADFDPTASANAIAMLDFARVLPQDAMRTMMRKYLVHFRKKHSGEMPWLNYTAYEIRIVSALVRIGMRNEANELLDFFLADRRPLEWNQWPEISWRDYRAPGHLGDVPHTWIAAEYVLAVASMVADERDADDSLVLAPGLRRDWVKAGFSVRSLPTRTGSLDFSIQETDGEISVTIGGSLKMPPGGITVAPPLPRGARLSAIEVKSMVVGKAGLLKVTALPASGKFSIGKRKELRKDTA